MTLDNFSIKHASLKENQTKMINTIKSLVKFSPRKSSKFSNEIFL